MPSIWCDRALMEAERLGLLPEIADLLATKGIALASIGRLREGIGVIEIGERIASAHDLTVTLVRALNNRSAMLRDIDRRGAAEAARDGLALARRIGSRPGMYSCLTGVGDYELACLGDADAALATFESGLGDETDSGDRLQLLSGVFLVRAIRGEDVSAILREMEGLASTVSDPRFGGSPERAMLALLDGRYGTARDGWRAAVTSLEHAVENHAWAAPRGAPGRRCAGSSGGSRGDRGDRPSRARHRPPPAGGRGRNRRRRRSNRRCAGPLRRGASRLGRPRHQLGRRDDRGWT